MKSGFGMLIRARHDSLKGHESPQGHVRMTKTAFVYLSSVSLFYVSFACVFGWEDGRQC